MQVVSDDVYFNPVVLEREEFSLEKFFIETPDKCTEEISGEICLSVSDRQHLEFREKIVLEAGYKAIIWYDRQSKKTVQ